MTFDYLPWDRPAAFDDRLCVGDDQVELTYAEFGSWVDAAAEQLAEHGVTRGSVVAIMLPNRVELLIAMVASWRLGAAATPINPAFTANEAEFQIEDSGAVVVINSGPQAPSAGRPTISADGLRRTAHGTNELPDASTSPDETALLIYTSGSTGRPKGVIQSHSNLVAMAGSMVSHLQMTGDDHCLLVLPLFHSNAIHASFLSPTSVGGRLTILSRFQPVPFMETIERVRPTFFSAVPTIYSHLVSLPEDLVFDTSSIRVAVCGAAPASKELLEAAQTRFGFPLLEGYGLTEGTCASTATPLDGPHKVGTVGIAMHGQTVAIMNPDGTLAPQGQRGEIVIQGPNVMVGYLNQPEATAEALGDGWLHTGDVGILDEDGYLSIVDRIKDMIIRGGENLYPKEIETVLYLHPDVLEAAVVGEPHEALGEVVVAYVSAYPGKVLDTDALLDLCRENLMKVKVPTRIDVLDELPKNPVGKIDKPTLRTRKPATANTEGA